MKASHNRAKSPAGIHSALLPAPRRPDLSPEGTTRSILMCILPTFKLKFHYCYRWVVALRKKPGKSQEKVGFGNLQNILGRTLFKMQRAGLEVEPCVVSSAGRLATSTLVNTLIDWLWLWPACQTARHRKPDKSLASFVLFLFFILISLLSPDNGWE